MPTGSAASAAAAASRASQLPCGSARDRGPPRGPVSAPLSGSTRAARRWCRLRGTGWSRGCAPRVDRWRRRVSARRALTAARDQSLLNASRPASSRQPAASAGHRAVARSSTRLASAVSPRFARLTASSTAGPHIPGVGADAETASGPGTAAPDIGVPGIATSVQRPERSHARRNSASSRTSKGFRAGS